MKNNIIAIVGSVLEKMGISYESIEEKEVAGQTLYCIITSESGKLIGQRGDVLFALNSVVNQLLYKGSDEHTRVTLDVNDYKKAKIDKIVAEAHTLAERARDLRYDVEMKPANGYERMIVHACLAGEKDLSTTSIGEGMNRRIVIKWLG